MKEHLKIKEIREKLQPLYKNKELRLAVLFGSIASGRTHKYSDIDIALLYDNTDEDIIEATNTVMQLLKDPRVDLVDLRLASPLLGYQVARKGIPLYERKRGQYAEFVSLAMRKYIDSAKIREAQKLYIESFLKQRGKA